MKTSITIDGRTQLKNNTSKQSIRKIINQLYGVTSILVEKKTFNDRVKTIEIRVDLTTT